MHSLNSIDRRLGVIMFTLGSDMFTLGSDMRIGVVGTRTGSGSGVDGADCAGAGGAMAGSSGL